MRAHVLLTAIVLVLLAGCDRNIEPFVEGEQPREPDLSRIFPEGGESGGPGLGSGRGAAAGVRATLPPTRGAMGGGAAGAPPVDTSTTGAGETITGTIEIAPAYSASAPSSATLFVIARREQGGGPPLAVRRFPAAALPLDFELGPQHVMLQGVAFEGNLRLTARLDGDGNAMTREAGDLSGEAQGLVRPGSRGVRIVLDQKQ